MVDAEVVAKEVSSKLRGYDGLTAAKLGDCPNILEALGTDNLTEALKRFTAVVEGLPEDKYTGALKNAFRLDPLAASSLTGRSGRRAAYGLVHSVSEETVKSWETRSIETLATALTAKTEERLREVAVVFWVNQEGIVLRAVIHFWLKTDDTSIRQDVHETLNRGRMSAPLAAYQLGLHEQPEALQICLIFASNLLPEYVFGYGDLDIFGFITGSYEPIEVTGPKPAIDLLQDLLIDREGVLKDCSYYGYRWFDPKPMGIYGMAWY